MNMRQGLYGLNEPALPVRPPSRLRKIIKFFLIICAVIFVSLMALHLIGGTSDNLRETVEKFLSESTGYKAKIGKLNAVSFYPLIGIDMDDVVLEGKESAVVARFSHINFSTSFWDMSSGSSFHTLDIRDAAISPGVFAPGGIDVARFYIDAKDRAKPKLSFKGFYDKKPLQLSAELSVIPGFFGGIYFTFADPSPFTLSAGNMHANGNILTDYSGRSADVKALSAGPNLEPVTMKIALINEGFSTGIKGVVQGGKSAAEYNFSFSHPEKKKRIQGLVKSDRFEINDLLKPGGLMDSQKAITTFYRAGTKPGEKDFGDLDLDIAIEAAHLLKNGKDLGAVSAKLVTGGGALRFEDVKAPEEAKAQLNALLPALRDAALK